MKYEIKELQTDVLVVGGGVGGLTAAISVKECDPDLSVTIIEKQTTGYAGKANKGGGVLQYFDLSRMPPEEFAEYHVHAIGCFLGDQDLMIKYVSMNNHMFDKMVEWGGKLPKNEDGSYRVMPTGPMTAMITVDLDVTLQFRRTAEKLGVKIFDKVTMSDLLTDKGAVSGATAYSILDGTFYVISAKTVILATGSQNYRIGSMWGSGRGDGIAAAYRSGAQMRNAEFGNFAQLVKIRSHNEVVFGENFMHNRLNENVTQNFRKEREPDISSTAIREWYVQMCEGNGPIHLDYGSQAWGGGERGGHGGGNAKPSYGEKFRMLNMKAAMNIDTDLEVCPLFLGEQSPVKVGHDMQTSISGLFAIGDASYCGSTAPGAVPAPPGRNRGSGILNAVFSGIMCAEGAAKNAKTAAPRVDKSQVEVSLQRTYAPLERKDGCTAKDVIRIIQSAVGPMEQSVYMRADRIAKALDLVLQAKELAKTMKAVDFHDLLACHEAEAMVLTAEMQFRAAEMRKESRGWFLREDYPEMDNDNWLKWIIVKNENGQMTFSTEDVPYEKWAVKPQGK